MPDEVIKLKAVDEASGVIDRAAKNIGARLRAMKRESTESGESSLAKVLSGGPEQITESLFGLIGEGVQGLAAGFVGETLEKFTDGMVEARNQIAEGKADARELADQFVRSVPILGSFVATFENIRELLLGEKEALEDQEQATATLNTIYSSQLQLAKQVREERERYLITIRDIRNEEELAGKVGLDRQLAANRQAAEKTTEAAAAQAKQDLAQKQATMAAADKAFTDFQNSAAGRRAGGDIGITDFIRIMVPPLRKGWAEDFKNIKEQQAQVREAMNAAHADLQRARTESQDHAIEIGKEAQKNYAAQNDAAEREAGIQRAETARQVELQVGDARTKAQQEVFERQRDFLKANLIGLMNDYNRQVSDINAAADRRLREDAGDRNQIQSQRRSQLDAAAAKYRQDIEMANYQEQIRQNDLAAHAAQVNDQLAKGKLESLKMEAAMGNTAAGIEAQRLKIQIEYNEKREEYNRILRDEAATVAQKAQAQRQLSGLDAQEALAMKLANMPSRGYQLNTWMEAGRTTGVAARAREENDPMRQAMIQAARQRDKMTTLLETIAGAMGHFVTSASGRPPRVLARAR